MCSSATPAAQPAVWPPARGCSRRWSLVEAADSRRARVPLPGGPYAVDERAGSSGHELRVIATGPRLADVSGAEGLEVLLAMARSDGAHALTVVDCGTLQTRGRPAGAAHRLAHRLGAPGDRRRRAPRRRHARRHRARPRRPGARRRPARPARARRRAEGAQGARRAPPGAARAPPPPQRTARPAGAGARRGPGRSAGDPRSAAMTAAIAEQRRGVLADRGRPDRGDAGGGRRRADLVGGRRPPSARLPLRRHPREPGRGDGDLRQQRPAARRRVRRRPRRPVTLAGRPRRPPRPARNDTAGRGRHASWSWPSRSTRSWSARPSAPTAPG